MSRRPMNRSDMLAHESRSVFGGFPPVMWLIWGGCCWRRSPHGRGSSFRQSRWTCASLTVHFYLSLLSHSYFSPSSLLRNLISLLFVRLCCFSFLLTRSFFFLLSPLNAATLAQIIHLRKLIYVLYISTLVLIFGSAKFGEKKFNDNWNLPRNLTKSRADPTALGMRSKLGQRRIETKKQFCVFDVMLSVSYVVSAISQWWKKWN